MIPVISVFIPIASWRSWPCIAWFQIAVVSAVVPVAAIIPELTVSAVANLTITPTIAAIVSTTTRVIVTVRVVAILAADFFVVSMISAAGILARVTAAPLVVWVFFAIPLSFLKKKG